CYACAGLFGRRFVGLPSLVTAAGQASASSLVMLPMAALVDHPWTLPAPGPKTLGALAALALLSTALAYVVYFRILSRAGATTLLLVTFLIPPGALLLGWVVLDEHLEGQQVAGMALVGLGLAAIDGRLPRLLAATLGLTPTGWRARAATAPAG